MTTTTTYTMLGRHGEKYEIPDAIQVALGLVVFRLPEGLALNNPARWNIGHHSGRVLAEALRREDAIAGAELIASLHDWTKDVAALREEIDEDAVVIKLSRHWCEPVNSNYLRGDVSRNGIYTDADIEAAAAEYKADDMNALEIVTAMSHTVPWSGLDTDDFNEASSKVIAAAGAK
ncbi:hypothetical protein GCM10010293_39990 [Streptomyces griseoflavus]|uniref:hypothetical protein n=1 Tax=Streptomyces griseoflavus TaxID=35619 RepID=UPI00167D0573|nr:hypothetical protein [Streptomyces griseoflavus]GGV36628.1 hypothetical protein GCM10010293_39990 [Streptomyces griseoflavus]